MQITQQRYKYMSIRQLEDLVSELREECKRSPERGGELQQAYKALQDKIRERDKRRPRCVPWMFEHSIDVAEEF